MIAVIACGNPNRRDDGVGSEVMRMLKSGPLGDDSSNVLLLDAGTDGMSVMFAARGCRTLIVVDACVSGSEPGAVFEVPGQELNKPYEPSINLHDFRWDNALHAGRAIFGTDFPSDVIVILVEAKDLDFGLELTEPVARAADTVVRRVEAMVAERMAAVVDQT
ncbi:MAG: hydrogenase maturation protease [Pseudomonadota bacterium]